jgi:hypothetical protein
MKKAKDEVEEVCRFNCRCKACRSNPAGYKHSVDITFGKKRVEFFTTSKSFEFDKYSIKMLIMDLIGWDERTDKKNKKKGKK